MLQLLWGKQFWGSSRASTAAPESLIGVHPCPLGSTACLHRALRTLCQIAFIQLAVMGGNWRKTVLGDLWAKFCDGAARRETPGCKRCKFLCRRVFPNRNRRWRTTIQIVMGGCQPVCHRERKISKQACRNLSVKHQCLTRARGPCWG